MPAEKTECFFHKTFKKLTKLLSHSSCKEHGTNVANRTDRFRCGEWRCDYATETAKADHKEEKAVERKATGSSVNARKKKQGNGCSGKKKTTSEGEFELARRMKELEMMDGGDMEQVLDVEEALHYYSRLKSPVYVEIVDRFFMDMYDDFSAPPRLSPPPQQLQYHPSALSKCDTGSRRRLGSFRC